jgi:uncharacterized protein YeaO (DUF488 family)
VAVRTKRVYEPASADDGYRVLVDRVWPRGVSKEDAAVDEWARELAPSTDLRKWFAHKPERFEQFRRRYRDELNAREGEIDALRTRGRKETVTLLFGARDVEHNNAVVLAELVGDAR